MKCCTNLLVLDLVDNSITSKGAIVMADNLNNFQELQALSLSKNNIGLEGMAALVRWIKLIELQLGHNNIDSDGACELTEGLRHVKTLQKLDVQSNNLGPVGLLELAKGLMFCTNMRILWLDDNGIDRAGAQALVKFLCDSQLENLHLSDICVSELTNILRYCQIKMNGGCCSYQSQENSYRYRQGLTEFGLADIYKYTLRKRI